MQKKPTFYYGADMITFENAKRLRNNLTFAEKKLWEYLSNNKLGVRFKSQHPVSNFIVDFYCHKAKLIIEIDGDSHFIDNRAIDYDRQREQFLANQQIKILRFTNDEVTHNIEAVVEKILNYLP